jgi:hypothetical protein
MGVLECNANKTVFWLKSANMNPMVTISQSAVCFNSRTYAFQWTASYNKLRLLDCGCILQDGDTVICFLHTMAQRPPTNSGICSVIRLVPTSAFTNGLLSRNVMA